MKKDTIKRLGMEDEFKNWMINIENRKGFVLGASVKMINPPTGEEQYKDQKGVITYINEGNINDDTHRLIRVRFDIDNRELTLWKHRFELI